MLKAQVRSDKMEIFMFYFIAAIIVISAIAVVVAKNIVHSALLLIVTFIGIGALYITLNAEFVGLVQILVYVGAVSILLIFGIMLTRRGDMTNSNPFNKYKIAAAVIAFGLFGLITKNIFETSWVYSELAPKGEYVEMIPEIILIDMLVPFQLAGLLLLVAMVGAIVLAKGVKN